MFKNYLPIEYLCIDIANAFGLDKELFEDRIQWVKDHVNELEELLDTVSEDKCAYIKAVLALRAVQRGEDVGHLISLDATNSGIQIMSAITGCRKGAEITNLLPINKRYDGYGEITNEMNNIFKSHGADEIKIPRKDAKDAVMTSGYGSRATPKEIFGEGETLEVFYDACFNKAEGAFTLMDILINAWQPFALAHSWVLPDLFVTNIKVMEKKEVRIEVDELNHATFTTYIKENEGSKRGVSLVANTIHSIDAYLLRNIIRRCNYNPKMIKNKLSILKRTQELRDRNELTKEEATGRLAEHLEVTDAMHLIDTSILPLVTAKTANQLDAWHITTLIRILTKMLEFKPCQVLTVHDAFRCHPNHGDTVRYWYKEIMAELAESEILNCILWQITGINPNYAKLDPNLADDIRNCNYAIC